MKSILIYVKGAMSEKKSSNKRNLFVDMPVKRGLLTYLTRRVSLWKFGVSKVSFTAVSVGADKGIPTCL